MNAIRISMYSNDLFELPIWVFQLPMFQVLISLMTSNDIYAKSGFSYFCNVKEFLNCDI